MREGCAADLGVAAGGAGVGGFGGWAFRQRSWLPVPLAVLLVVVRAAEIRGAWVFGSGVLLVAGGQALRFWAVRHIGAISRTRAGRLGPLITTGPFAHSRNPLYVGNWLIWTGFVVASELLWMLPVAWMLFAIQYGAIVRWEEDLLSARFPLVYRSYAASVPRWGPLPWSAAPRLGQPAAHRWTTVLFSERGTLIAAGLMLTLLVAKALLT